jgi:L-fuconate dehydratase
MFDYLRVSGSMENRMIEYVDHLHEHFTNPVVVQNGHYRVPLRPGNSIEMLQQTLEDYDFVDGRIWKELRMAPELLKR